MKRFFFSQNCTKKIVRCQITRKTNWYKKKVASRGAKQTIWAHAYLAIELPGGKSVRKLFFPRGASAVQFFPSPVFIRFGRRNEENLENKEEDLKGARNGAEYKVQPDT